MNNPNNRLNAFVAYLLPLAGWLYVIAFARKDPYVRFHLKQAVGLVLFLIFATLVWAVVAWLLIWLPYVALFSFALFSLVIFAYAAGFVFWIMGMINALKGQVAYLPVFGKTAQRLPL